MRIVYVAHIGESTDELTCVVLHVIDESCQIVQTCVNTASAGCLYTGKVWLNKDPSCLIPS